MSGCIDGESRVSKGSFHMPYVETLVPPSSALSHALLVVGDLRAVPRIKL